MSEVGFLIIKTSISIREPKIDFVNIGSWPELTGYKVKGTGLPMFLFENNNMIKAYKIIILPKDQDEKDRPQGGIYRNSIGKLIFSRPFSYSKQEHLYILTDDNLKEGDWQYTRLYGITKVCNLLWSDMECAKKVECSSDHELGLPLIPNSFLPRFVKAYNDENVIIEIKLEVSQLCIQTGRLCGMPCNGDCHDNCIYKIKVNDDNTVIIHQDKKYSIQEVENLIYDCLHSIAHGMSFKEEDYNDWVKENL